LTLRIHDVRGRLVKMLLDDVELTLHIRPGSGHNARMSGRFGSRH